MKSKVSPEGSFRRNYDGDLMVGQSMDGMPQNELDMRVIKAAAKSQFGHIRGVQGFGIGDRALRIYITDAQVKAQLPTNFRGVPVVLVVTGEITAALRAK